MTSDDKLSFIFGRRSIRVYAPGEVPDTVVQRVLEAAMAAPSAMTKDPWRFVVVRKKQTLAEMANLLPGGKMLGTAALAIAVCGDQEVALDHQLSFLLQDCAAATENLLLGAHALGLGACWIGVHPSPESITGLRKLLSLPGSIVPVAVVSLGPPGEQPEARTRYVAQYVHRDRWGAA